MIQQHFVLPVGRTAGRPKGRRGTHPAADAAPPLTGAGPAAWEGSTRKVTPVGALGCHGRGGQCGGRGRARAWSSVAVAGAAVEARAHRRAPLRAAQVRGTAATAGSLRCSRRASAQTGAGPDDHDAETDTPAESERGRLAFVLRGAGGRPTEVRGRQTAAASRQAASQRYPGPSSARSRRAVRTRRPSLCL